MTGSLLIQDRGCAVFFLDFEKILSVLMLLTLDSLKAVLLGVPSHFLFPNSAFLWITVFSRIFQIFSL